MMNIVGYFSKAISCKPHRIRNNYIRESKRHAIVTTYDIDDNCIVEESLVTSAIKQVKTLLQRGDKVVVCSSTKAFTEKLDSFIAETMPDKRVLVYNSSRASGSDRDALDNVNDKWVHYDLLVYSPNVSAGVSFTEHHYDSLVAYLVNSRFTPGVDLSLQQLFRVRNLAKGEMHIHVHNKRQNVNLPYTVRDIERSELNPALSVSSSPIYYEAQMMIDPHTNTLSFDRDRLSYQVLLGIKLIQNKSAMFYTDLLCSTLQKDYKIAIVMKEVELLRRENFDTDIKLLKDIKVAKNIVSFDSLRLLNDEDYSALRDQEADLTDEEKTSMKLYVYRRNIYGVTIEHVDEKFYKAYVEGSTAYETYLKNKRFRLMVSNDLTENKKIYAAKMQALVSRQDYNIDLYKTLMATHHKLLLTSQTFLQLLLSAQAHGDLRAHKDVVVKESHVSDTLDKFVKLLKAGEYQMAKEYDFFKLFQITEKTAAYTAFKNIMRRGLGLEINRGATNCTRPAYQNIHMQSEYGKFEMRYSPTYPTDM